MVIEKKAIQSPQGVVACFINENGRVIASANCFGLDRPGGFKLEEAQRYYAKTRLFWKVAKAYCSPDFVRGITSYHLEGIIEELIRKHNCKIHYEFIGCEDRETE